MGDITVEQCIESFPHTTFPKQLGEPNYEKIQKTHKLAAANAASAETTRGGGNHGYLAIVLEPNTYHTLTGHVFMPLTNPGPLPVITGGLRTAQVEALKETHKIALQEYKDYRAVCKVTKQIVIKAFEDQYTNFLQNVHTGYNNVTIIQIFQYLCNIHGRINEHNLQENEERIRILWNLEDPIKAIFQQIKIGVEYTQNGNALCTNR